MTIVQQEPGRRVVVPVRGEVSSGFERLATQHRDMTLTTVFQPIFSLSHQRGGYEARCARTMRSRSRRVAARRAWRSRAPGRAVLDRLAQALHLENFALLGAEREWLFLNVHPGVLTDRSRRPRCSRTEAARHAAAPRRARSARAARGRRRAACRGRARIPHARLPDRARRFRRGSLEPRTDLAAEPGHREARPDHAVASRRTAPPPRSCTGSTTQAARGRQAGARRGHRDRARGADRAVVRGRFQGLLFRPAAPGCRTARPRRLCIGELTERFRQQTDARVNGAMRSGSRRHARVRTCGRASRGGDRRGAGTSSRSTRRALLPARRARPPVGRSSCAADRALAEARFSPLADAQGANWLRRSIPLGDRRGRVQVTRPYLSINEAQPCVTLSVAVRIGDAQRVQWRYRLARRRSGRRLAPRASRAARWRPSRGSARMRELS